MDNSGRFRDENKRLSDFYDEVWVKCPKCSSKAFAKADHAAHQVRLFCLACGYSKELSTELSIGKGKGYLKQAAHHYFGAELWLQHPFKDNIFYALNDEHLRYLEQYIGASLREHRDRSHFTLLEKLPRFYHEAKNRESLLKIIRILKEK